MNYANPFDEERMAQALEVKGRPIAAALTRGAYPTRGPVRANNAPGAIK